jgi:phosphate/sulfate permease
MFNLILYALITLAVFDLIVGVSNDAVNFLNSAIGSKSIPIKKILIIASLGIFVGAVFSSGMMEVARKGIFNPGEFYFDEIMFIFLAVMIGDILLLDFFNTLGLPTSTTVSIVFNLLGAAVMMSLIKIGMDDSQSFTDLVNYINTEKALQIISGILLSVVIAFTAGTIIQWVSRIIFTFQYEKKIKNFGFLFASLCLTSIGYFIFFKGLKGTPYYAEISEILKTHFFFVILCMLAFWTVITLFVDKILKKNVLILVIGVGTFGLALAFAGNDLVNFIGVPMAAYHSFEAWSVSGIPSNEFSMEVLSKKVPAEPFLLIISGLIMVLTLWFSKKAKLVTETEIGLSRQNDGDEKFNPNLLSKIIVKTSSKISSSFQAVLPKSVNNRIESSFKFPLANLSYSKAKDLPAFDLIRASVNLSVAGILISIATSMKLPLSTTYVTFMVAMGTSLADRAWGRESAVYRVAGVINVIGGWFSTAIVAFLFAGFITYILYIGKGVSVAILLLLVAVLLVRNYLSYKKNALKRRFPTGLKKSQSKTVQGIIKESSDNVSEVINRTSEIYSSLIIGLSKQEADKLKKCKKNINKLDNEVEGLRNHLFYFIKNLDETSIIGSSFYISILAYLTDITQSLGYMAKKSFKHVENHHKPLKYNQIKDLTEIQGSISDVLSKIQVAFSNESYKELGIIIEEKESLLALISEKTDNQIKRTRSEGSSPKNTALYFNLLLESKDLVKSIFSVSKEYFNSAK